MSYFTSEMFLQETRQLMIWKGKQRLKGRAERKEGGERSDEEGPHRQPATMQEEREIILAPPATSQIPRTGPKLLRPPYNVEPLGQPNPHLYVCQKRDSSPIGSPPKYRLRLDEIASNFASINHQRQVGHHWRQSGHHGTPGGRPQTVFAT